ncbi:NAD(P)H-quinone oxidoreductase [Goodfellowiella coeruleoviolacea]|uniref:NADPH2:quinone reductase n=1 Tax=Goodfellowiella coeruleoviolacea TaxID=334858 RepID=A0AAE3GBL9_9PSEU|nr:NAD(P)H-quinone oxidoreductase [Goodfellowiella coeruleoviolacea]MCP2164415.1 NADPH2:quinone reductase [Goodfellowiella coeruleoviolacea]
MHAITVREPGGPEVLEWTEVNEPAPGAGEVLIDVAATAVNRADLMQRQGFYPPPPGASDIIGLECAGTIAALGPGVEGWRVGDEVCALLAGGGYAERVAVPAAQLLPVPAALDLVTAATLPEVACTVWSNVVMGAGLTEGDVLLVHGGAGGIGTHAIQVGKALGATVAVTAGSDERLTKCRQLGADITVNYRTQDFVAELRRETEGHGADVILDNMGASYLDRNVEALANDGRLVVIGLQGGRKGELDLNKLLVKRASVTGTGLRGRPVHGPNGKGAIIADMRERLWPLLESGVVRPVVHNVLDIRQAGEAHRMLDEEDVFGKLALKVR